MLHTAKMFKYYVVIAFAGELKQNRYLEDPITNTKNAAVVQRL